MDDKFIETLCWTSCMVLLLLCIFLIIAGACIVTDTSSKKYDEDHGYRTYVTVYYPDQNKSVEGYLDEFSLGHNYTCRIVIEGVEYTCDSRNVIFSMRRLD